MHRDDIETRNREARGALLAYLVFCVLTYSSRWLEAMLPAAVFFGLLLPLIWGWRTGRWAEMGFRRAGSGRALVWGLGGGLATMLLGYLTVSQRGLAADWLPELAVALPIWGLLASPFQEFLFRGWLQTRFERRLGGLWGLLVTTLLFVLWHFCMPLEMGGAVSAFPLASLPGIAATTLAGLIYAVVFQRAEHILAPWLAHTLAGLLFAVIGAASFLPG